MNKIYSRILISFFLTMLMLLASSCFGFNLDNIELPKVTSNKDIFNKDPDVSINEELPSYANDKTCFLRNSLLNNKEQIIYDILYDGMINNKTTIKLSSVPGNFNSQADMKEMLSNAVYSVLRDHPQLFMYSGAYTYEFSNTLSISSVVMEFKTIMSVNDAQEKQKEIDKVVNDLITKMTELDEYNKSKYIYTYLAQNTTYQESENAHNMYGCLVEGISVCEGYAEAYSYIMQKCGMDVAYISGTGKGELHAWNIIKIDNAWYHIDCTWGDPLIDIEDPEEKRLHVDYSYLHLTTDSILINHTIDEFCKNIPVCTSIAANYYVKEASYLTDYSDKALADIINNKISEARDFNKEISISIRYSIPSDVQKANKWLEDGKIKNIVKKINYSSFSYSWSCNDVGTITIKLLFKM